MSVRVRRLLVGLIVSLPLLLPSAATAQSGPRPTVQELAQAVNGSNDWFTYGGAMNNQRYSSLNQITTANVATLKAQWMTHLGSGNGSKYRFEADPIVVDGVMYIPTGNDDVFALDAKTGKKIWEYNSDIPQVNDLVCCGWDNRGVAVGGGRVYTGLLDGSFVALDQATGKLLWRTQLEDYHDGYSLTGAYRYYDGLVFTGISGAENGIRGYLAALDANDGHLVWRFYNVAAPDQIGGETWPSPTDPDPEKVQAYTHGGASVWQAPAIDPELGMIYYSTGNAGPYDGSVRPGDNLFTASIVALDYKTGQYRWHFQEVHHDIWDFDAPSPVVLFDQTYNGQQRKGLYQPGKTGWVYFLDRTNGQPLIGINEQPVEQEPRQATAATQPIPVGDPFINQCGDPVPNFPVVKCIYGTYWDVPVVFHPLGHGGSEWSPSTYDPQTGYVYVMGSEQDSAYAVRPLPFVAGKTYTRVFSAAILGAPIKSTFTAIDSRTNKVVWQKEDNHDQSYGALSTGGGLVFRGKVDGNLVAYDARTGDELWKFQTGLPISAPPMAWSDGTTEYITIAVGGNRGGLITTEGADQVWTFSLNGTFEQVAAPGPIQSTLDITAAPVRLGQSIASPQTPVYGGRAFDGTMYAYEYAFTPQVAQVPVGTTLTWQNDGAVVHTATAIDGSFDTGDIPGGGGTASVTFGSSGTFTYNCSPHPWMLGRVIVQ
jgi:quinohemoprotein ethanol dehydrogenase